MRKAGGIIGLIAGVFGVLAALFTLVIGAGGAALKADGASTIIGLGWGGIVFSFLCIIFGAVAMNGRSRWPGGLLILPSVAGAILGGTIVAIFMALSLVGGVLAVIGGGKPIA